MMWFKTEVKRAWWHSLAKYFLILGPIPRHIAFIMDGNRRFARKQKCSSFVEGHRKGFEQLTKVLEWCLEFGVKEVTVYAFSLENFKRSAVEVTDLLTLFEQKLVQLLDERDQLTEKGIRIRFFGNLERLPPRLRQLAAKIEHFTSRNDRDINLCRLQPYHVESMTARPICQVKQRWACAAVNVCIAYTAQDEIRRALVTIARGVQKGLLTEADIKECLISQCLDSRWSDPDLLIRTSGETRLSDFLLWQCSKCCIYFDQVLWPDFDYWNLCKAIYLYQCTRTPLKLLKEDCLVKEQLVSNDSVSEFLRWTDEERLERLRRMTTAVC